MPNFRKERKQMRKQRIIDKSVYYQAAEKVWNKAPRK